MDHWKTLITRANARFKDGDRLTAREQYLQALALAQVLFDRWPDADEAVAALVVSHHNLADLHLQLGQPEEAAEYLCAIHERLLEAADDTQLRTALRECALRHSRCTYTELLGFIGKHGEYPRTRYLLGCSRATHTHRKADGTVAIACHQPYGES